MAKEKQFIWLADSCDWSGGAARLETGRKYDASAFPPEVVEFWVTTGAAKWARAKEE
jgi:hypothetical protein